MSRLGKIDPAIAKQLAMIETEINNTAATVWDISSSELQEIQLSLTDLQPTS